MMGRSQWWILQASIVGTCVAVALAAGIVLIPRTMAPKPMEQAAPATVIALQQSMDNLSALLEQADDEVAIATGADAGPTDDMALAGAQAYSWTWLSTDNGSVVAAKAIIAQCRTLIKKADAMLDPDTTLVGLLSSQADPRSTPQVITMDEAEEMPAALDDCWSTVEPALATMDDELVKAKTIAAVEAATTRNAGLLDALRDIIATAHDALNSRTATASADARAVLSEQIEASETLVNAPQPTTWQELDQQSLKLSDAAQSLSNALSQFQAVQSVRSEPPGGYTGGNGNLDLSTLCPVPYDQKQLLRCDAEAAWMRLDAAYKDVWGVDIPIDLSYRTYEEQVEMKQIYGSGAAAPGTSNHGWGTAVDLPDYREGGEGLEWNYGTPKYEWMKAYAPAYGWVNPSWAVQGGVGPHEPWHFEYVG